jgi:hypothetical protein
MGLKKLLSNLKQAQELTSTTSTQHQQKSASMKALFFMG